MDSCLARTLLRFSRLVGREDDHDGLGGVTADELREVQTIGWMVAAAELDIEDRNGVPVRREMLESAFRGRRGIHDVPLPREVLTEREDDALFVVDNQNSFHADSAVANTAPHERQRTVSLSD